MVTAQTRKFDHRWLTARIPSYARPDQPLYSLAASIVNVTGGLSPPQSNLPGSVGDTRTNLPLCTCIPTRHTLPTLPPTSIFGTSPPPSKSCTLRTAVSRFLRVIAF